MGRLQALIIGSCGFVVFCNDPVKPAPTARSEQVVTSASAQSVASGVSSIGEHGAIPTPRGPVCDTSVQGRALSKTSPAFVDGTGVVSDRVLLSSNGKRAQWISFFASWCGPCKEEIPRIQSFAKRLERDGIPIDVAFVSIDDDLRQLTAFFGQQPESGVKTSYWLKDGPARTAWLAALKMKSDPPLPENAIVDAKSRVRCFVSGAIEEADYAQIAASLR